MFTNRKNSPTSKAPLLSAYRLEAGIQRSEFAFQTAEAAERRGDTASAEHFLEVAIREEAAALQ